MKLTLLLTLLFLSVACNNFNSTSTDPSARNFPFDNSVYISLPHHEGKSILRRKLLNLSLLNLLKENDKIEGDKKIKSGDEFRFLDDKSQLSLLNMEEYKKLETNAAEVIVSYEDRLEIYFVPTGIERQKAFSQLRVAIEPETRMSWVDSTDNFLLKDKIYYLLSATKENLLENDVCFNQHNISLGNSFNEKSFSFSSNQNLELEVSVEYSFKETTFAELGGQAVNCTRDMREADMCSPCSYKLETPTGRFIKKSLENSELVDLDIIINGRKYHLNELNPEMDLNGNFRVAINLKKMTKSENATVLFQQNTQRSVLKNVKAVEMSPACVHREVNNTIDITPTVKMNLELKVKGRDFSFLM